MLLVLDIGNSNTVIGVYDKDELIHHWRVVTRRAGTADEYGITIKQLMRHADVSCADIEGIAISCVVPPILPMLSELGTNFFKIDPLLVGPGVKTGMAIRVDNPKDVGADRIVNAVAAHNLLNTSAIVVDFGTATTFDYVSENGTFEGGIIAPGMAISTDALFKQASKLPRVELVKPKKVIGKNTVSAMQSGIVYGYAGLVDSLIDRIKDEVKNDMPDEPKPVVIATGGLANTVSKVASSINTVDEFLTLRGLHIIYERNKQEKT